MSCSCGPDRRNTAKNVSLGFPTRFAVTPSSLTKSNILVTTAPPHHTLSSPNLEQSRLLLCVTRSRPWLSRTSLSPFNIHFALAVPRPHKSASPLPHLLSPDLLSHLPSFTQPQAIVSLAPRCSTQACKSGGNMRPYCVCIHKALRIHPPACTRSSAQQAMQIQVRLDPTS